MNTYTVQFFAFCPVDGERILYTLSIETNLMIMVESINDAVTLIERGFHEKIADGLLREFGGRQVMTANHHGVEIKTVRQVA